MQESITFTMTITKKITEVIKFATEKLVNDKLQSYCDYDEMIAEQFENWLNEEENSEVKKVILFALEYLRDKDLYTIEKLNENIVYYNKMLYPSQNCLAYHILIFPLCFLLSYLFFS